MVAERKLLQIPRLRERLGVIDEPPPPENSDALAQMRGIDICDFLEDEFYIPAGGRIQLPPHQKVTLRVMLRRSSETGRFVYTTSCYSTIKKSGKSTIAGGVVRWQAETQTRYGEIFCVGNDLRQARERSFREMRRSIELAPGFIPGRDVLPGRWQLLTNSARCLTTGSVVQALAVDARGEAGGAPALSVWTELWGFEYPAAIRFWDELTTVPTIPDSIRLVETYAGFEGESLLLYGLYSRAKGNDEDRTCRQMTNGEAARIAARDRDGERYEDFLNAWHECEGDPDALVPIYVDDVGKLFIYWDEGENARRMPWQRGIRGAEYYAEQEASNRPNVFLQHHRNLWTGSESAFVPMELWDRCYDPSIAPLAPGDLTPVVVGVDAASTGDCFGVVVVSRHPDPSKHEGHVAIRQYRAWTPPKGGRIDYIEPEGFVRFLVQGGCAAGHPQYEPFRRRSEDVGPGRLAEGKEPCAACDGLAAGDETLRLQKFNVLQVAYDPYQLEDMSQRFARERVVWTEEFRQKEQRSIADRRLYDLIVQMKLAHREDPTAPGMLRRHIQNANGKVQKEEDSKLRIVKKIETHKIDLAVAASMAVHRCLELLIPRPS